MALTETEKADIRYFLGYSMQFHNVDTVLERAMSALAQTPEGETIVRDALVNIKAIDTKLLATHSRLQATKVCKIELAHKKEICALRAEGRRYVGRIASFLGVPVRHDSFSSQAPKTTASWGGLIGGSNYGKHG